MAVDIVFEVILHLSFPAETPELVDERLSIPRFGFPTNRRPCGPAALELGTPHKRSCRISCFCLGQPAGVLPVTEATDLGPFNSPPGRVLSAGFRVGRGRYHPDRTGPVWGKLFRQALSRKSCPFMLKMGTDHPKLPVGPPLFGSVTGFSLVW